MLLFFGRFELSVDDDEIGGRGRGRGVIEGLFSSSPESEVSIVAGSIYFVGLFVGLSVMHTGSGPHAVCAIQLH